MNILKWGTTGYKPPIGYDKSRGAIWYYVGNGNETSATEATEQQLAYRVKNFFLMLPIERAIGIINDLEQVSAMRHVPFVTS